MRNVWLSVALVALAFVCASAPGAWRRPPERSTGVVTDESAAPSCPGVTVEVTNVGNQPDAHRA